MEGKGEKGAAEHAHRQPQTVIKTSPPMCCALYARRDVSQLFFIKQVASSGMQNISVALHRGISRCDFFFA